MTRIIFFDFDGTIYSHSTYCFPQSTVQAFNELKQKDVITCLCTGRCKYEVDQYFDMPMSFDYYIYTNGQLILDKDDNIIYHLPMFGEDKENLLKIFNENIMPLVICEKNDYYINYVNEVVEYVTNGVSSPVPPIKPYSGNEFYMVSIFPGKCEELIQLTKDMTPNCHLEVWNDYGYDVVSNSCDKAKAIAELIKILDIPQSETMAFGDGENDIPMIKFAQIGVVMGNGKDEVKQCGDYVCDHIDNDGLYKALKHFEII